MPLLRSFRVKTLLIIIPFIVFYLLLQNQQQLPTLSKLVPNTDWSNHAAKPPKDDYRGQHMSDAPPPPLPPQRTLRPQPTFSTQRHKSSLPKESDKPFPTGKLAVAAPSPKPTIIATTKTKASSHALSLPTLSFNSSRSDNSTKPRENISKANDPAFRKSQIEFWKSVESLLDSSNPDCDTPKRLGRAKAVRFDSLHGERPKLLKMPEKDVETMRKAHQKFVEGITGQHPQMVFTPGSQGLVSTAGGKYLPIFVISLRMLRRTGTTLPVEVFLADQDEYEEHICEEVLPSLNATCVIMSDILSKVPHDVEITKYQFKVFAMIFSSFEEILFLDADSFPVHNPEELFSSKLFKEYGLISWPDFWASSTSEYYYTISQQKMPAMDERASSETGELLISKKTHQRFLLLATYYNYYGPTHYYPLLSQGSPGEGDKDTFLPAANVVNQTFYATSEPVQAIGYPAPGRDMVGSAMVQFDPMQDYNVTTQQGDLRRVKDDASAAESESESKPESPRPFFVHANFPKFDPANIFVPDGPARDANGTDRKAWTLGEKTMEAFGFDVEKDFWSEIKWVACTLEKEFDTWKGKKDICKNTTEHWDHLYHDEE